MATYDSRVVKGWRSRMADEAAELRRRMWQAPARVVYTAELEPPRNGDPAGHERWFQREFGEERALAKAALQRFRFAQAEIEQSEITEDQREARRAYFRAWRARQSDDWRRTQTIQKRARRAADPERYRAIDRRHELRRRVERNAQRRAAYAANPEAHRAKLNARREVNREQQRATARAAYARRKLSQLPPG